MLVWMLDTAQCMRRRRGELPWGFIGKHVELLQPRASRERLGMVALQSHLPPKIILVDGGSRVRHCLHTRTLGEAVVSSTGR